MARKISYIYGYPPYYYPVKEGEFYFLPKAGMTEGDRAELARENESLRGMHRRLKTSAAQAKKILPRLVKKENKYLLLDQSVEHTSSSILKGCDLSGFRTRSGLDNSLVELRRNNR